MQRLTLITKVKYASASTPSSTNYLFIFGVMFTIMFAEYEYTNVWPAVWVE